jgi:hypothetical protein
MSKLVYYYGIFQGNAPKDHASKEAENALNKMQEDLSNEDLVSAHIDRWTANQWLKVSKSLSIV